MSLWNRILEGSMLGQHKRTLLLVALILTLVSLPACGLFKSGNVTAGDRLYRPLTEEEWHIACRTLDSLLIDEGEGVTQYARRVVLYPLVIEGVYEPIPPDSGQEDSRSAITYTFLLSRMTLKYYSSHLESQEADTSSVHRIGDNECCRVAHSYGPPFECFNDKSLGTISHRKRWGTRS